MGFPSIIDSEPKPLQDDLTVLEPAGSGRSRSPRPRAAAAEAAVEVDSPVEVGTGVPSFYVHSFEYGDVARPGRTAEFGSLGVLIGCLVLVLF